MGESMSETQREMSRETSRDAGAPQRSAWLDKLPSVAVVGRQGNVVPRNGNTMVYAAQDLVDMAMSRVEDLNDEVDTATEAGRITGYQAGRDDAMRELARELHRVEREQAHYQSVLEASVVDIAIATAKKSVGVQLSREDTHAIVASKIRDHESDQPYAVYVAEDAFGFYREALDRMRREAPDKPVPALHIDPRLAGNRAVLRTRFGSVDLDLESQIDAMRHQLEDQTSEANGAAIESNSERGNGAVAFGQTRAS